MSWSKFGTELTTILGRQLGPWPFWSCSIMSWKEIWDWRLLLIWELESWPFWSCSVMSWKEIWDWTDNYLGSGSWEFLLLLFLWISFFSRWGFCDFYFLERRDWVHLTMPYALPQHIFLDLERVLYGSFLNGSCMSLSWTGLEGTWGQWILERSLISFLERVLKGLEGNWYLKCPWFVFLNGSWRDLKGLEGNGYLKRLWFIFLNGSCRDLSGTDNWNVPDLFSWMGLEETWGELILERSLICFLEWVLRGLERNGNLKCPWFISFEGELGGLEPFCIPNQTTLL